MSSKVVLAAMFLCSAAQPDTLPDLEPDDEVAMLQFAQVRKHSFEAEVGKHNFKAEVREHNGSTPTNTSTNVSAPTGSSTNVSMPSSSSTHVSTPHTCQHAPHGFCNVGNLTHYWKGRDCKMFDLSEMSKPLVDWTPLTRWCKMTNYLSAMACDQCLVQGCLADGDLDAGATQYYKNIVGMDSWPIEANYCWEGGYCGTHALTKTSTAQDVNAWCDIMFGDAWRKYTVSDLLSSDYDADSLLLTPKKKAMVSCAMGSYHCDWGYCQKYFCGFSNHLKNGASSA